MKRKSRIRRSSWRPRSEIARKDKGSSEKKQKKKKGRKEEISNDKTLNAEISKIGAA